jgi:hypothetical protein
MTALAILGLLFVLLAIGTPVGFAMAFAGSVGLLVTGGTRRCSAFFKQRRSRR